MPRRLGAGVVDDLEDDYGASRVRHGVAGAAVAGAGGGVDCRGVPVGPAAAASARRTAVLRDLEMAWRGPAGAAGALGAAATLSVGVLAVLLTAGLARALLLRPVSARHGETCAGSPLSRTAGGPPFACRSSRWSRCASTSEGRPRGLVNLQPAVLRAEGADLQTMIEVVDGGYFELIGGAMRLGRALVSADDRPAAPPVVVISEGVWRRRFGGAPAVIGRDHSLNGDSFAIVGVTAASGSASALGAGVDVWTTLAHADGVLNPGWRTDPEARWFAMFVLPAASVSALDGHLETPLERWRNRSLRHGDSRRCAASLAPCSPAGNDGRWRG